MKCKFQLTTLPFTSDHTLTHVHSVRMSLRIELSKVAFRPGENVQGQVILKANEPMDISGIYLQLQGMERVRFRASVRNDMNGSSEEVSKEFEPPTPPSTKRHSSKRNGSSHQQTINTGIPTSLPITQPHFLQSLLLTVTLPVTRFRGKLPVGVHSFPFSVNLPSRLPPSLHFSSGKKYLAEVIYEFTVQVFRPHNLNAQTLTFTSPLRVLSAKKLVNSLLPSTIEREVKAQHFFCCFPAKEIDFSASWKENIFFCGQEIPVSVQIFSASVPPSRLCVKLVQELILNISGQFFRHVSPISKSKFVNFNSTVSVQVPFGLVPTTQTEAIECRYFLVFEVDWRWAESSLIASEVEIRQETGTEKE